MLSNDEKCCQMMQKFSLTFPSAVDNLNLTTLKHLPLLSLTSQSLTFGESHEEGSREGGCLTPIGGYYTSSVLLHAHIGPYRNIQDHTDAGLSGQAGSGKGSGSNTVAEAVSNFNSRKHRCLNDRGVTVFTLDRS